LTGVSPSYWYTLAAKWWCILAAKSWYIIACKLTQLQLELIRRPEAGVVIPGSGGLRKVRWSMPGRGKRSRARVIYYWAVAYEQLLMLLIYPKNVQDDLTPAQVKLLRQIVEAEYP
jgi:hypothetical protein